MSWRRWLYFCLLSFVVTLALIIGWRLSDQAMAVIVGVVAGVVASIPTSLMVVWLALRARRAFPSETVWSAGEPVAAAPAAQPRVIIVQATPAAPASPTSQRSLTVLPAYAAPEPTAFNGLALGPRHFTLLGEDNEDV
jgi:hypothetical protein